ncbi:MAG: branched-chain amino acid ABC transporter permease [Gordonia polyisoprenivorans]|nr:branched-chain amino acid ABC transporter permease [Gordonia polyisoprenivorans]
MSAVTGTTEVVTPGATTQGMPGRRRLPTLRTWHVLTVAAVLLELITTSSYLVYLSSLMVIYAIAALGQALLIGKAGQVALGGAAVMLIGSEVTGIVAATSAGTVFLVPLACGVAASGVAGLIVGIPGLRFKGLYLILATLALQAIASFAAQQYETDSSPGGVATDGFRLGGFTVSTDKGVLAVLAVFLVAVMLWMRRIYRGPSGRILQVLKERDDAAAVFGIDVRRWKLWAFACSSMITGLAGGLLVCFLQNATYSSFSLQIAINLLVMVFLGGATTLAGPVIGAFVITAAPDLVRDLLGALGFDSSSGWLLTNISSLELLLYGLALLIVLLYQPAGITGAWQTFGRHAAKLITRMRRRTA